MRIEYSDTRAGSREWSIHLTDDDMFKLCSPKSNSSDKEEVVLKIQKTKEEVVLKMQETYEDVHLGGS